MRLATFNVLHGRSLDDGAVERERFRAAVALLDADVLGMQEVDRGQARSGHIDLTAVAAEASGAVAHRFAPALIGTPGEVYRRLAHDDDGTGEPSFGVSLISRWPIRSWHVTRLTGAPVRSPIYTPGPGGRFTWLRDEPRVVLAAVVEGPDGPFTVATTHLSFVPAWNAGQLRLAVRALRRLPPPRVLLGDLNMPARAASLISGWRPLARTATYPAWQPRVQLDHVLLDRRGGARWPSEGAVEAPRVPFSDHRPLVVDTSAGPPPRRPGADDY
ncbi:endonuclease/exonuclease/phosphatase family protein [Phytohabitans suffuscus]|uniref:Endonuclease/exonuclease/phosphatase n=1 Tax=Phytohabitans suffuscus TaxID=624315 RepID=A0A6F8YYC8_9ACTN|nr:endonuclease/exonuclease/phosphatase family protein [Phytohabitans suffuscus]BCB91175.1 endonuclease/exonuclease/phosphatase [Phytohabitans suffuscus]